ncbi:putative isopenicillin N synthase [Medicago truncatula]|uniref:Leucoanthocyanidin dioxygenase, putative n=1 Tax=Medicago truncatula TaxID=3880 RepID=G7KS30_MEDTR|nr:leucoanthocyanidin dioxygenase, putative [Medicago truncatula]RHN45270.1 putative isopenicillin N synthase [Medicago truncatula]
MSTTPTNLIDFLVNQANGVKGLTDLNLPSIPHQYIQPIEVRIDKCKIIPQDSNISIPIIDFTNWDDLESWGFFQIVNHGMPINVLDDLKASVHGIPINVLGISTPTPLIHYATTKSFTTISSKIQ